MDSIPLKDYNIRKAHHRNLALVPLGSRGKTCPHGAAVRLSPSLIRHCVSCLLLLASATMGEPLSLLNCKMRSQLSHSSL